MSTKSSYFKIKRESGKIKIRLFSPFNRGGWVAFIFILLVIVFALSVFAEAFLVDMSRGMFNGIGAFVGGFMLILAIFLFFLLGRMLHTFEWLTFDGEKLRIKKGTPFLKVAEVFDASGIAELEFIEWGTSNLEKDPRILSFGKGDKIVFLYKDKWYSFGTEFKSWNYVQLIDELNAVSNFDFSMIEKNPEFRLKEIEYLKTFVEKDKRTR